jgi:hypothetical protein
MVAASCWLIFDLIFPRFLLLLFLWCWLIQWSLLIERVLNRTFTAQLGGDSFTFRKMRTVIAPSMNILFFCDWNELLINNEGEKEVE